MMSALARECSLTFFTRAGIEIGVASTKAFTTQLVALSAGTDAGAKPTALV
jgi:glucosamine 6-phosphate synthetase-like amidotransferase/phosphosugar isomerase protein